MTSNVAINGFAIIPQVISEAERNGWISHLGSVVGAGKRGLLDDARVNAFARSDTLLDLVRPHLPANAAPLPVRGIYFDKSADANWLVPWHQDLTLALQERQDTPGYGPWSVKDGVHHVQPPVEVLERMLTIRLHLDDADESNGALKVLPGTHTEGKLTSQRIQELRGEMNEFLCAAASGDAMLMRPLLLHASGRSTSSRHRRILHLEYAAVELPEGLRWHGF